MATDGETRLSALLEGLAPALDPDVYCFVHVVEPPEGGSGWTPLMSFQEAEGQTLVLPLQSAIDAGLAHDFACRRITLRIHSALDAVGLLAAVTSALAAEGIAVNVVSAYFHDHLFVPEERAADALRVLESLSGGTPDGAEDSAPRD